MGPFSNFLAALFILTATESKKVDAFVEINCHAVNGIKTFGIEKIIFSQCQRSYVIKMDET